MFPLPLTVKPVRLPPVLAVQLKVVPAVVEVNVTAVLEAALQIVCGVTGVTLGSGFTVIVSLAAGPAHPEAVGVIT